MTEYRLFPGIRLIIGQGGRSDENENEIFYCMKGVCEYSVREESYYLTDGKCIIAHDASSRELRCMSDCCGISVLIGDECGNEAFSGILDLADISGDQTRKGQFIFQADDRVSTLFSDIYAETERHEENMMKVKVLELLVLLAEKRPPEIRHSSVFKRAGQFICRNTSVHYTIEELSHFFGINPTTLKNGFRERFCCTVYDYAKKHKMFRAAELLRDTDMRVIDVAEEVGYSNASKFSSAFCSVVGMTPKRFRMEHKNGIVE